MECLLIAAQLAPLCDNGIVFTQASSQRLFKFVILVSPLPLTTSSTTCYQITRTYLFSILGSNNNTFLTSHAKVIITSFHYFIEIIEMRVSVQDPQLVCLAKTLIGEKYTKAMQTIEGRKDFFVSSIKWSVQKILLSYKLWNPGWV